MKTFVPRLLAMTALVPAVPACVTDAEPGDDPSTAIVERHGGASRDRQLAEVLPPDAKVAGKTRAQWEAEFNVWVNSIPLDQNPAMDPSRPCDIRQSGPVFFTVSGVSDCTIPEDKYLFLPIAGASNTFPCADPDIAAAMGQPGPGQSLADFLLADVTALTGEFFDLSGFELRVDGQLVPVEPYHQASTLFTFQADPTLAIPDFDPCYAAGTTQSGMFDGWVVMMKPMKPGIHTVTRVNHLTGSSRTITFRVVDDD